MRIIDSNLIIYSALPEYEYLRSLIKDSASYTSAFTRLEVLGYHLLNEKSKRYFENVFYSLPALPITDTVLLAAIDLRQKRKISAGDALIAATALQLDFEVYTRNVQDFDWIPNLRVVNPVI